MSTAPIFGSVQSREASGDRARASKVYPSSATSADITNTFPRSVKEAEYFAEKAAAQSESPDKLERSLFGHDLESYQHKRALDPETPTKTSSDIFSPQIPTSPLPQYSYPPQYSPPQSSQELPKEATPGPQRRTPTRQTPREVSPPPKYHKEDVVDLNSIYSRETAQTSRKSKPTDTFDCYAKVYSLAKDHEVVTTTPESERLALAASRESPSSKKEFKSYKRKVKSSKNLLKLHEVLESYKEVLESYHTMREVYEKLLEVYEKLLEVYEKMLESHEQELGTCEPPNHASSRTEEPGSPESDDLRNNILGDIAAIGGSSSRHAATRGAFHHALNAERRLKL
ncbi:hypothetical protein RSOLAG22IIIB_11775 [Rhizoctonia solani]|uniref:Uncharacterized protein n=1 Tax=Rhizoctonia solani TaxID=456999 RepID=A0A0K6GAW7_9AGAM|nr:hypothetical protein RSOLAG22IIIB_11775 [Rhizoctonia solani]